MWLVSTIIQVVPLLQCHGLPISLLNNRALRQEIDLFGFPV